MNNPVFAGLMFFTVHSSHGDLCVDAETGEVDRSASDYFHPGDPDGVKNIIKFDIEEFCVFWGADAPQDCDILDIGYWVETGDYEPPAMDWRLGICIPFLCMDIDFSENTEPTTPGELLALALEGRSFGAQSKK